MSHILCYLRIFIAHLVLLNLLLTNTTVPLKWTNCSLKSLK